MSKIVTVEYDAASNALRLVEPVEGLSDRQRFQATLDDAPATTVDCSWLELEGCMDGERGEEFARVINEMFPPWEADE